MLWIELAGVATVGTSLVMEEWFPDASVWSGYGIGYGFVPLALPIAGLLWLRTQQPSDRAVAEHQLGAQGKAAAGQVIPATSMVRIASRRSAGGSEHSGCWCLAGRRDRRRRLPRARHW